MKMQNYLSRRMQGYCNLSSCNIVVKGVAFFLGCQWLKWSWATRGKNKILFNHVVAFKLMKKIRT